MNTEIANQSQDTVACQAQGTASSRRGFLRNSMLLAVPVVLGGVSLPAAAAYAPPVRPHGNARINVRDKGAAGNGSKDDTAAFQAAINALPSSGGTVYVPDGTYIIDTIKSINMRSRTHLLMTSGAVLKAKSNRAPRSYVILANKVSDVEISGGRIVGDRYRHLGTTGEWGHGIFIRGAQRVTIRDVHVSDCWGDGISLGAALVWQGTPIDSKEVVIANVVCTNNRRQGLSSGRAHNVKIYDSEFSGSNGTAPECGIDIEPDIPGVAYKVHIENCLIRNNRRYGVLLYKRAQGVTLKGNIIERNGSCGLVTVGAVATYLYGNTIRYNSATGLFIQDGTRNFQASSNTFYGNYSRLKPQKRTAFTLTGLSSKIERDILVRGSVSNIRITANRYR